MPFYQPSMVFLAYLNYLFPDSQCRFSALTDISKSIAFYLHDEKSIYRVLAVDLCSRGFHVWQHYIDSMEILRSLINLSTRMRKDSISVQNVGSQARLAVLAIAGNSMPLLMGTMCLDILTPPSVEHRRSVLQILAFLIRKVFLFFDSNKDLIHLNRLLASSRFTTKSSSVNGSRREISGSKFHFQPRIGPR